MLRYQPAVALVYVSEKGKDLRVKFAIDGRIDDEISRAFAQQGGVERMGIAGEFSTKAGLFSLQKRIKDLSGPQRDNDGYGALLTRRSILRWNIRGIETRLKEGASPELDRALAEKLDELDAINKKLGLLPIRDLYPFEMSQLVRDALTRGKQRVIFTTTLPSPRKMGKDVLDLLRNAAKRGVHVSIFISGKPASETSSGKARNTVSSELDKIAADFANARISFLEELKRNVFEVVCDDELLAVTNDPPFGDREREKSFRPFYGVLLSQRDDVVSYVNSHLNFK